MGLTIKSPNSSIDVSYGGLYRLRSAIASMVSAEFGEAYDALFNRPSEEEEKVISERLNRMISEYESVHGAKYDRVFEFLFAPDTGGTLSYGGCRTLQALILTSRGSEWFHALLIGYAGWERPATGADFMGILNKWWKSEAMPL